MNVQAILHAHQKIKIVEVKKNTKEVKVNECTDLQVQCTCKLLMLMIKYMVCVGYVLRAICSDPNRRIKKQERRIFINQDASCP